MTKQISLYVSDCDKKKIQLAANINNVSVSKYVVDIALKQAREDVKKNETIILGNKERDLVLYLLDNPPQPNEALIELMK